MMIHLSVRIFCLMLLSLVAVKQYQEYQKHENGAKRLRLNLFMLTIGMIVLVFGMTAFHGINLGFITWLDQTTIYTITSTGMLIISVLWFYIYFIKS